MKNKEIEELLNELKRRKERYIYYKNNDISFSDEDYNSYLLLSYIEQLQKKVDQYENPEDLTLFYMWLDKKAKDKMKQLEKENKEYQKELEKADSITQSCIFEGQKSAGKSYRECLNMLEKLNREKKQLENNRDKAIEVLERHTRFSIEELIDILKR